MSFVETIHVELDISFVVHNFSEDATREIE